MLLIRDIVYATDFSANTRNAWEVACALARDYNARLHVVYVERPQPMFTEFGAIPPPSIHRESLMRELDALKPTSDGILITRTLLEGDEATEIRTFAERIHANLIVMGTHGRTGLGRLLMGSVAEEVLRTAPCPVLTVKNAVPVPCPTEKRETIPA